MLEQALPVQGAPEMPVRGMDQSHCLAIMPGAGDSSGHRRPARRADFARLSGMQTLVVDHPLVAHKLTTLRDSRTDTPVFRRLADELVTLLAYEATRHIRVEPVTVPTPVVPAAPGVRLSRPMPAGRAGPAGRRRHAGRDDPAAAQRRRRLRRHGPRRVDAGRVDLRRAAAGRPVRPRGRSSWTRCWPPAARWRRPSGCWSAAAPRRSRPSACWPPRRASPGSRRAFPGDAPAAIRVVTAAVDQQLNDQGYIVPGLGDAGDRLFGTI